MVWCGCKTVYQFPLSLLQGTCSIVSLRYFFTFTVLRPVCKYVPLLLSVSHSVADITNTTSHACVFRPHLIKPGLLSFQTLQNTPSLSLIATSPLSSVHKSIFYNTPRLQSWHHCLTAVHISPLGFHMTLLLSLTRGVLEQQRLLGTLDTGQARVACWVGLLHLHHS